MKSSIKKIAVLTTMLFSIGATLPVNSFNFLMEKSYASTKDSDDLSELKLKSSSGNNIRLYDSSSCKSDEKVDSSDVKDGGTYYAKSSTKSVKIDVDGADDDKVRVFLGRKDSAKGVKVGRTISLSSGTNTLTVRVYKSEPESNVKYKDNDDVSSEYTLKVKCNSSDKDDDDDNDDDIYLENISLSDGNINFSKKTNSYNIYVNSSVDDLTIKAKPDDDDDIVKIDGSEVDESDNYKHKVSLDNGKNEFEIKVEDKDDSDNYRRYTLYVYRGNYNNYYNNDDEASEGYNPIISSEVINTNNDTVHTAAVTTATNKWSIVNGHWAYIDSLGRQITNSWFYDSNTRNYYYFNADGSMATGWKNINGKWYYMYSSGAMAKDTTIGEYTVDSSGAWVY